MISNGYCFLSTQNDLIFLTQRNNSILKCLLPIRYCLGRKTSCSESWLLGVSAVFRKPLIIFIGSDFYQEVSRNRKKTKFVELFRLCWIYSVRFKRCSFSRALSQPKPSHQNSFYFGLIFMRSNEDNVVSRKLMLFLLYTLQRANSANEKGKKSVTWGFSIFLQSVRSKHMEVVEWSARLARKRAFRVWRLLAPSSMMHVLL